MYDLVEVQPRSDIHYISIPFTDFCATLKSTHSLIANYVTFIYIMRFCNVILCTLLYIYPRRGWDCCLYFQFYIRVSTTFRNRYKYTVPNGTTISTFTPVGNSNLTFLKISYRSGEYKDEFALAAAWLWRATNDSTYLSKAESLYNEFCLGNWNNAFNWDNKISGAQVRYVV